MLEVYERAVPVLNTSQSLSHSMSAKDVIWACVISDNKLFVLKHSVSVEDHRHRDVKRNHCHSEAICILNVLKAKLKDFQEVIKIIIDETR